jgi:hypothetical protein
MYSGSDQRPCRSRPPAKLVDSQSRLCGVNLPPITTGRNCGHLVMGEIIFRLNPEGKSVHQLRSARSQSLRYLSKKAFSRSQKSFRADPVNPCLWFG